MRLRGGRGRGSKGREIYNGNSQIHTDGISRSHALAVERDEDDSHFEGGWSEHERLAKTTCIYPSLLNI